ncbi:MAG TPA: hypothetical protein DDY77_03150, partial [Clostridiales bacterium]|nr:hypothetical protein [Clostridiales bacterium]
IDIKVEYNGQTLTGSQSVKGYLETLLASKPASVSDYAYEYLKTLAYDLLDYGSAAQSYKGETDKAKLVNGGDEKGDSFFESDITDKYEATTENVKWGAGARYDYFVKPVVKFSLKDTSMVTENSQVYAKVKFGEAEEKQVEVEKLGDNGYIAVLNDFDLLKADEVFTVTAYLDGTPLDTFTNSFASLAKKVSNNNDKAPAEVPTTTAKDVKLIFTTYVYAKSAVAYSEILAAGGKTYVFEAENATINKADGATVTVTTATTASNGKYIDKMSDSKNGSSSLNFVVNAPKACTANLLIRSCRHPSNNRNFDDYYKTIINGTEYKTNYTVEKNSDESITDNQCWTTFYDMEVLKNIELKAGENTIVLQRCGLALNLDAIKLVCSEALYNTYTFEAEEAELSNTAKIEESGTASGGKYLASLNGFGSDGTIRFTVYSDSDSLSALYLRTNGHYASEYSLANYYKVTLNGTYYEANSGAKLVKNRLMKDDNCWKAFHDTFVCYVPLKKGENVITLSNVNAAVNFDAIKIDSSARLSTKAFS